MTGEMDTDGFLEEIIDRCVQRIANGEPLDAVMASYPAHAAELRSLLAPAHTLMSSAVPPVGRAAESMALNGMLAAVQAARAHPRSRNFLLVWFASLKARPLAYQLFAIIGAAAVFGGVTLGAAAATGTAPTPVRRILRISADSEHRVVLHGTIASLGSDTLTLRTGEAGAMDVRTIALTGSTTFSRGDQVIARGDLHIGDVVEIEAAQSGERIEATVVRAKAANAPAAGAATTVPTPAATSAARSPVASVPGSADAGATPGRAGSPASGSGDERTPEHRATPQAGETPQAGKTPQPGEDQGGGGGAGSGATRTPIATVAPGDDTRRGTPESTQVPSATERPQATQAAEPTQQPEPPESGG